MRLRGVEVSAEPPLGRMAMAFECFGGLEG